MQTILITSVTRGLGLSFAKAARRQIEACTQPEAALELTNSARHYRHFQVAALAHYLADISEQWVGSMRQPIADFKLQQSASFVKNDSAPMSR